MILVASDDKLRNISWKVFSMDESLCCVPRVSVSRIFQDQEKMEEAETVHRQALQAGKQRPFPVFRVSWFWYVYEFMALFHHTFHTFAVCVFNIYFSTYSKNPAQHPETCLEDWMNVKLQQVDKLTLFPLKFTWQEREKQLCSTHPWTLLCYSRLAHVLQLRGKIHEAPEKLPGILGVRIWCVACTWFPASKEIE